MNDISTVALFCSDVRLERAGTESLIGVYPDRVNLPSIPGAFAQMTIYVRMHLLTTYRPVKIEARVILPGGAILDRSELQQALVEDARQKSLERGSDYFGLIARFHAAPLRIEKEGRIEAIVTVDESDITAGALNCRVVPT